MAADASTDHAIVSLRHNAGLRISVAIPYSLMNLRDELRRHFGHDDFRAGQQQVIESLLAGRSALAVFPTGAGKSLCYQLPAVMLDGLTLVISPLIALMKDQVEALRARGISAARLDSSLTAAEVQDVFAAMKSGGLRLLYVAPERLTNESFIERLSRTKITLLAIDEAHCISEWGHNFRPEYLRLAAVARRLKLHPVLALTATATPGVARDIERAFDIAAADSVQTPFHRSNLVIHVTSTPAVKHLDSLTDRLKQPGRFPAIVYVTLQQTSEQVATHLQRNGIKARAYHAGMTAEHRTEAQDAFMSGVTDVIVATIAFGMGIDKADIRSVFHFNLPKTLENYQQEIGRAGRDGLGSHCEVLACADDLIVLENFVFGDTPTPAAVRQLVDHLMRRSGEFDISHYDLSRVTDIRPLVLETVLTYLELDGILTPLGALYTGYQFRLLQPEARILSGHTTSRQTFLKNIFTAAKRGPKWITVQNVDELSSSIGESRDRIIKALGYLEESGDIELRPSGLRHRYRLCDDASRRDPATLTSRMQDLFARREEKDAGRLQTVMAFLEDARCLTRHLLRYFGEDLPQDCGHCGNCLANRSSESPDVRAIARSPEPTLGLDHVAQIQALIDEGHAALRAPRQLARFLCGITSPATSRDRLTRHDAFGLLSHHRFEKVLAQAESMMIR